MSTGRARKPAEAAESPRANAAPVDDAVVDAHAAGEIAHHWHEAGNWPRPETVLTDRALLGAIFTLRPRSEVLGWWLSIERATGARIEERYEAAWRRWDLDVTNPVEREEARSLAMCLVLLLFEAERCGDFAERLLRTALRIDAEDCGDDSREVGIHLGMLARLLHARGDHVLSEVAARRALTIAERTDGPDSWTASVRFNTLAGAFLAREDYAEAARLYRRSLAIAERNTGPQSDDLLPVLENLVNALVLLGDFEAAEPQARHIVAIAETAAEPDPLVIGRYVHGLANVLEGKGDHAAAVAPRRRALSIAEKGLGDGHPITLQARMALAETLIAVGEGMEAEALLRRVVEVAGGGEDDAANGEEARGGGREAAAELLSTALLILGELLLRQDRHAEAAPFLERVLAILDAPAEEGETDPVALTLLLQQLGVAYREMGRLPDADGCLMRAKAIAETDGFPRPLLLANVLSALGQLRAVEDRLAEAEELFVACLAVRREHLPAGDSEIVRVEGRLVAVRERASGRDSAARTT